MVVVVPPLYGVGFLWYPGWTMQGFATTCLKAAKVGGIAPTLEMPGGFLP